MLGIELYLKMADLSDRAVGDQQKLGSKEIWNEFKDKTGTKMLIF